MDETDAAQVERVAEFLEARAGGAATEASALLAAWKAAQTEHDRAEDERAQLEEGVDVEFPAVIHGRRRTVYTRDEEIDRAPRLSDATKARLKATLARRKEEYEAARQACGLAAAEDRVEVLCREVNRLGDAIIAERGGTLEGVRAKAAVAERYARDCGYSEMEEMLRVVGAELDAVAAVPDADTKLLAYERRLVATSAAYNAPLPEDAPRRIWKPLWNRMRWLERQIAATPAAGIAGAAVKLRTALRTGTGHGSEPDACLQGALMTMEAVAGHCEPRPERET